jgi:hypothetical protein
MEDEVRTMPHSNEVTEGTLPFAADVPVRMVYRAACVLADGFDVAVSVVELYLCFGLR